MQQEGDKARSGNAGRVVLHLVELELDSEINYEIFVYNWEPACELCELASR